MSADSLKYFAATNRVSQTYLAISIALALHGVVQISEGTAGVPGCIELISPPGWIKDGMRSGEEKERRYSAIKKSSFRAHTVKRTFCDRISLTF